MRKIAGPGHVSNGWVDYDPNTNPLGTVFTADWGNDVQNELIGIQAEMGIAEAAGTNKYVLAALIGLQIKNSHRLGELLFIDGDIIAPAEFDKDNPSAFFPALCLDNINTYSDIDVANWPLLVPFLRAKSYKYLEGLTGAVSAFELSAWDITTNVATITFANNAANIALITALAEEFALTGYRQVVNIPATVGNIAAGDKLITGYNIGSRTLTFAEVASNGSGATTQTVTVHANRIVGSTTTARVYGAKALAVMSAGTATHISGGMRRSYMQGHRQDRHPTEATAGRGYAYTAGNQFANPGAGSNLVTTVSSQTTTGDPVTDGVNGTPRTGTETEPRSITAHLYEWAGSYIAP